MTRQDFIPIEFYKRSPSVITYIVGAVSLSIAFLGVIYPTLFDLDTYPPLAPRVVFALCFLIPALYLLFYQSKLIIIPEKDTIERIISLYLPVYTRKETLSKFDTILLYDETTGSFSDAGHTTLTYIIISLGKKTAFEIGGKPSHYEKMLIDRAKSKNQGIKNLEYFYRVAEALSKKLDLPVMDFRHSDTRLRDFSHE